MKKSVWLLGGVLYTQDEKRSVVRANVHIVDGIITKITAEPPRNTQDVDIIDASGLTILPGFVQSHLHLCQTLFRNQADDLELLDWLSKRIWIYEAAHTEETLHTSALLGIHELLSSGTTCILDMGTVRHTEAILDAVKSSGIRASVGKCLMDHPESPKDLKEPTHVAFEEAKKLFRAWHGTANDRIRVSYAPRFALSCTDELLRKVSQQAKEDHTLIHTHASENLKEIEWIRQTHGCENIEYLNRVGLTAPNVVLAHCVHVNPHEQGILKSTGTHVAHCPSSNLKLASGFSPIPELYAQGINVALGADGAPCNNNLSLLNEMRLAALIHKPGRGPRTLPATQIIDMATRNGAKALNWFDKIGSIEVGKKADLVALNLRTLTNTVRDQDQLDREAIASSIVYATQPGQVAWTMVDGEMVFKNDRKAGKVSQIDEKSLMRDVLKAHKHFI